MVLLLQYRDGRVRLYPSARSLSKHRRRETGLKSGWLPCVSRRIRIQRRLAVGHGGLQKNRLKQTPTEGQVSGGEGIVPPSKWEATWECDIRGAEESQTAFLTSSRPRTAGGPQMHDDLDCTLGKGKSRAGRFCPFRPADHRLAS